MTPIGIDIVVPVLNRPQQAERVVRSISEATVCDHSIVFVCSPDDDAEIEAVQATGFDYMICSWRPGPGDAARKWNAGYRHTASMGSHELVLLAADDLEFEYGWDREVIATFERGHAGVVGTNDDANPLVKRGLHATHPVVSRRYIDETGGTFSDGPGIVYHEGYDHQLVDNELVEAAKRRGEWAFARKAVVRHLHPLYHRKRSAMDPTYEKALANGSADRRLYEKRVKEFGRSAIVSP